MIKNMNKKSLYRLVRFLVKRNSVLERKLALFEKYFSYKEVVKYDELRGKMNYADRNRS